MGIPVLAGPHILDKAMILATLEVIGTIVGLMALLGVAALVQDCRPVYPKARPEPQPGQVLTFAERLYGLEQPGPSKRLGKP